MTYSFPYDWADQLDLETLRHCAVYDLPSPTGGVPTGEIPPDFEYNLDHPVQSPSLAERVRGAQSVLILIDDLTRETPQHLLLPKNPPPLSSSANLLPVSPS